MGFNFGFSHKILLILFVVIVVCSLSLYLYFYKRYDNFGVPPFNPQSYIYGQPINIWIQQMYSLFFNEQIDRLQFTTTVPPSASTQITDNSFYSALYNLLYNSISSALHSALQSAPPQVQVNLSALLSTILSGVYGTNTIKQYTPFTTNFQRYINMLINVLLQTQSNMQNLEYFYICPRNTVWYELISILYTLTNICIQQQITGTATNFDALNTLIAQIYNDIALTNTSATVQSMQATTIAQTSASQTTTTANYEINVPSLLLNEMNDILYFYTMDANGKQTLITDSSFYSTLYNTLYSIISNGLGSTNETEILPNIINNILAATSSTPSTLFPAIITNNTLFYNNFLKNINIFLAVLNNKSSTVTLQYSYNNGYITVWYQLINLLFSLYCMLIQTGSKIDFTELNTLIMQINVVINTNN